LVLPLAGTSISQPAVAASSFLCSWLSLMIFQSPGIA